MLSVFIVYLISKLTLYNISYIFDIATYTVSDMLRNFMGDIFFSSKGGGICVIFKLEIYNKNGGNQAFFQAWIKRTKGHDLETFTFI